MSYEVQVRMSKRVQVAFTDSQWQLISNLRGEFGTGDADIVRNIVLAWLSEKSLITTNVKKRMENGAQDRENR